MDKPKDFESAATPEEKENMRRILQNENNVIIPPEVEEEMKKLGLTKEEIIAELLKAAGGLN